MPLRYRWKAGFVSLRRWRGNGRASTVDIRTTYLDVGVVGAWVVLYDAAKPIGVESVFEFPERVAC